MIRFVTLFVAIILATGCAAPKPKSSAAMAARPLAVEAPGALADAPQTALSPVELSARVHDLERRGRAGAASRLAAAHPDVARAALESVSGKPDPALRSLAAAFDRATASSGDAWSALFALRLREPARFAEYDAAHETVLAAFARGNLEAAHAALPLPVPADAPGVTHLRAISDRLEGLVALAEGDTVAATAAFRRASTDSALFHLLQTAAAERATDVAATATARDAALLAIVEGALAEPRWREPALLERLLVVEAPIADAVGVRVRGAAERDLGLEKVDDTLGAGWIVAGLDRLARGEARIALTDLRRAEESCKDVVVRARVREAQARALLALGQPAAARTILGTLATDTDPRIARPALATLGAIELRLERPELAVGLLRKSLDAPLLEWPGASAAEANFGLALITAGFGEEGLKRLSAAQARFELERDFDALAQSLENERLAHEQSRDTERLEAVRARIAAQAGL